jgi:hypothetical protein
MQSRALVWPYRVTFELGLHRHPILDSRHAGSYVRATIYRDHAIEADADATEEPAWLAQVPCTMPRAPAVGQESAGNGFTRIGLQGGTIDEDRDWPATFCFSPNTHCSNLGSYRTFSL